MSDPFFSSLLLPEERDYRGNDYKRVSRQYIGYLHGMIVASSPECTQGCQSHHISFDVYSRLNGCLVFLISFSSISLLCKEKKKQNAQGQGNLSIIVILWLTDAVEIIGCKAIFSVFITLNDARMEQL